MASGDLPAAPALAQRPTRRYVLALAALTVLAALRLPAIWYGYPFEGHVDEEYLVDYAYAIARTGDLDPHCFYYPSLCYYLLAALYRVAAWIGAVPLGGERPGPDHYVVARGLMVVFATAVVPVTAELVRRIAGRERHHGELAGLAAGLFAAISPLLSGYSFLATVNPAMAFWCALAAWPAAAILRGDRRARSYALAALLSGLALGTKYVAFPVALLAPWAHVAGPGPRRIAPLALYAAGVIAVFFATTPFALIDYDTFRADVDHISSVYRTEGLWLLNEGAAQTSYAELGASLASRALGPAALVLAGIGAFGMARRGLGSAGWKEAVLLAIVPVVSYLWLGSFKVYFARNYLGALPFLAALAGSGCAVVWRGMQRLPGAGWLAAASLIGVCWVPARDSLDEVRRALLVDTRTAALEWVRAHVPPGARLVREFGTPPFEELGDDYEVLYVLSIVQPDRRAECAGYDYVLVTWAYRRVVTELAERAPYVDAYTDFFERHELAAEFPADGERYTGTTIGIVRIRP